MPGSARVVNLSGLIANHVLGVPMKTQPFGNWGLAACSSLFFNFLHLYSSFTPSRSGRWNRVTLTCAWKKRWLGGISQL
jgi:hypothetical protein